MDVKAAEKLGYGIAWAGFWIMIGLANFGEEYNCEGFMDRVINNMEYISEKSENDNP